MVSFWPFKGDENSAASFEKILSQLSTKINQVSAQNDKYRLRRRKYKVLWSLYAVFGYMLIAAIFLLVIRFENWTAIEYTVVAGGPPFIYVVRAGLDSYYGYRISNTRNHLNELSKQREATIERLKAATKYNSTQQLLEKYGGSSDRQQSQQAQQKQKASQQQIRKRRSDIGQATQSAQQLGSRTGFAPPPTANIQSKQPQLASRPHSSAGFSSKPPKTPDTQPLPESQTRQTEPGAEFAPNAFSAPLSPPPITRQPSNYATEGPKWYDRILDVMLGEDEAHAKNRVVLICENCRLVNGQAPPGVRKMEEIGRWRCGGCHAWNGVESEEKRMLKEISQKDAFAASAEPTSAVTDPGSASKAFEDEFEHVKKEVDEEDEAGEAGEARPSDAGPASSTRSKARQKREE